MVQILERYYHLECAKCPICNEAFITVRTGERTGDNIWYCVRGHQHPVFVLDPGMYIRRHVRIASPVSGPFATDAVSNDRSVAATANDGSDAWSARSTMASACPESPDQMNVDTDPSASAPSGPSHVTATNSLITVAMMEQRKRTRTKITEEQVCARVCVCVCMRAQRQTTLPPSPSLTICPLPSIHAHIDRLVHGSRSCCVPRSWPGARQLAVLSKAFEQNPQPDPAQRAHYASQLGLSARVVQVWFQNRRAKEKRQRGASDASARTSPLDDMYVSVSEDGDSSAASSPVCQSPRRQSMAAGNAPSRPLSMYQDQAESSPVRPAQRQRPRSMPVCPTEEWLCMSMTDAADFPTSSAYGSARLPPPALVHGPSKLRISDDRNTRDRSVSAMLTTHAREERLRLLQSLAQRQAHHAHGTEGLAAPVLSDDPVALASLQDTYVRRQAAMEPSYEIAATNYQPMDTYSAATGDAPSISELSGPVGQCAAMTTTNATANYFVGAQHARSRWGSARPHSDIFDDFVAQESRVKYMFDGSMFANLSSMADETGEAATGSADMLGMAESPAPPSAPVAPLESFATPSMLRTSSAPDGGPKRRPPPPRRRPKSADNETAVYRIGTQSQRSDDLRRDAIRRRSVPYIMAAKSDSADPDAAGSAPGDIADDAPNATFLSPYSSHDEEDTT